MGHRVAPSGLLCVWWQPPDLFFYHQHPLIGPASLRTFNVTCSLSIKICHLVLVPAIQFLHTPVPIWNLLWITCTTLCERKLEGCSGQCWWDLGNPCAVLYPFHSFPSRPQDSDICMWYIYRHIFIYICKHMHIHTHTNIPSLCPCGSHWSRQHVAIGC